MPWTGAQIQDNARPRHLPQEATLYLIPTIPDNLQAPHEISGKRRLGRVQFAQLLDIVMLGNIADADLADVIITEVDHSLRQGISLSLRISKTTIMKLPVEVAMIAGAAILPGPKGRQVLQDGPYLFPLRDGRHR